MSNPSYRWVCHKCGLSNEPGIGSCSSCGSPAVVTGYDLEPHISEQEAIRRRKDTAERDAKFMLFFPEIIPAAIVLIGAPVWAISLAFQGHPLSALLLVAGVAVNAFGFFWLSRRGEKWLAYFAMLAVLFVAYIAYSATNVGAL